MASSASMMNFLNSNFSVSTGDQGEALYKKIAPFFGQIDPAEIKQSALSKRPVTTYDLPDVLVGENVYIRDTIDDEIFSRLEFPTTVVLPWIVTDVIHIAWNRFHFNHVLAGRVPHRGISRLVTSRREQGRAHSERKGLAMHLEADFYNTPEGVLHYWENIRGIAGCVQETQNYDTLKELLICNTYEKLWETKFGTANVDYLRVIEEEQALYACMIKTEDGLDIATEKAKTVLTNRQITPDVLLIPSGAAMYLTMVSPYQNTKDNVQTTYRTINETGQLVERPGPDALTTYRKLKVFEVPEFGVYDDEPPVQLLAKNKQIGEYYSMSATKFRGNMKGYTSDFRDIYIYDETDDDWKKISFLSAIANAKIYNPKTKSYHSHLTDVIFEHQTKHADQYSFKTLNIDNESRIDGERNKPEKDGRKPFHFLITEDVGGKPMLAKYFGQWKENVATAKDFEDVAATMAAHALQCEYRGSSYEAQRRALLDLQDLMESIEATAYNRVFFEDLIQLNAPYSSRDGAFAGEKTPIDVIGRDSPSSIIEWRPTANGSLLLPQRRPEMGSLNYPPGFANEPGLAQIAQEVDNPNSTWGHIATRALNGLKVYHMIATASASIFTGSLALDEKNRSPWFHVPSKKTTLMQNLFPLRDPIFLAFIPPLDASDSRVPENAMDESASASKIEYKRVFPFDLATGEELTNDQIQDFLTKYWSGSLDASVLKNKANLTSNFVTMTLGGTRIMIPTYVFANSVTLPKTLKVYSLMGQQSFPALKNLLSKMTPDLTDLSQADLIKRAEELATLKSKFINFLLTLPQRLKKSSGLESVLLMRKLVMYLNDMPNPIPEIETLVSSINSKDSAIKKRSSDILNSAAQDIPNDTISQFPVKSFSTPPAMSKFYSEVSGEPTEIESTMPESAASKFSRLTTLLDSIMNKVEFLTSLRQQVVPNYRNNFSPVENTPNVNDQFYNFDYSAVNNNSVNMAVLQSAEEQIKNDLKQEVAEYNKELIGSNIPDTTSQEFVKWQKNVIDRIRKKNQKKTPLTGNGGSVLVDNEAIAEAQYYRAPLTMSLRLLETALQDPNTLILPSDPETGHTYYSKPTARSTLPPSVYERFNYASISDNQRSRETPFFHQTTFISSLLDKARGVGEDMPTQYSKNKPIGPKSGGRRRTVEEDLQSSFLDEEEYSPYSAGGNKRKFKPVSQFQDEDLAESDSNDGLSSDDEGSRGRKSQTTRSSRNRTRKPPTTFKDPQKGWTLETLREKGLSDKGVDKLRPFESASTPNQTESFNDLYNDSMVNRFHDANMVQDPILKACLIIFLTTRCDNFAIIEHMIKSNIHVPINIYNWRISIEHVMLTFPMLKAGLETGANLYGNSNFVVTNDGISKMIYGNLTFYSKALVHRSENVMPLENVAPSRYVGGHNTIFVKSKSEFQEMRDSRRRASIIATAVPITETEIPQVMSISGELPVRHPDDDDDDNNFSYSTSEYYDSYWQFSKLAGKSDLGSQTYYDRISAINVVAKQGHQFLYNKQSGRFDIVVECKGHRGRYGSGPGAAPVWNGAAKSLPQQKWSDYNLV